MLLAARSLFAGGKPVRGQAPAAALLNVTGSGYKGWMPLGQGGNKLAPQISFMVTVLSSVFEFISVEVRWRSSDLCFLFG